MSRRIVLLVPRPTSPTTPTQPPPTTGGGSEDTSVPLVLLESSETTFYRAGVNTHFDYTGTTGFDNDLYAQNAIDSGFGWIRDRVTSDKGVDHRARVRIRSVTAAGVRLALIAGHPTQQFLGPAGTWKSTIWPNIRDTFGGRVHALMGTNEYLGSSATDTDRARLRDYQREIAAALESLPDSLAKSLRAEFWSPVQAFADRQNLYSSRFNDGVSTRGDMHSYPGGVSPVSADGSGSFPGWLKAAKALVPGAAPVATETGYHVAWKGLGKDKIDGGTIGHVPTNNDGYRIMAPRLIFDYAREGVHIAFLYQLRDAEPETALIDREEHFGLYTAAGAIKPQGLAMQRMLRRIKDAPAASRQERLAVSGTGVYHWGSARSNGSVDLVLWQRKDATKWTPPVGTDPSTARIEVLNVPTVTGTVRFGRRMRLEAYYPSDLTAGVIDLGVVESGVAKSVQVPHHILMLRAIPA